MVADIVDLNKRRFDDAADCTGITPTQALREALRQIEAGEWVPTDLIILGLLVDENDDSFVDTLHAGKATTNERLGMLMRAQYALMS